ncbi:MAG TPA: hypothetical protein VGC41_18750, partial [Kofleriaceae bacterium]
PNRANDHVGAYGYQIGFTPTYTDTFLAVGGVQLDSSDFIDIDTSTMGLTNVTSVTLSLLGRSYNTTAPGGFNWQTFDDVGATDDDFVSNSAPYQWYSTDVTTGLPAGKNVKLRIKADGLSGALVVHAIELCVVAQ